jgi:surface protein
MIAATMFFGVVLSGDYFKNTFIEDHTPVLKVEAAPTDFILEFTTTSASQTIFLPFRGTTNVTIDWNNDASPVTHQVSANAQFTYPLPGTYQIVISGSITTFGFQTEQWGNLAQSNGRLMKVVQWGSTGVTSLSGMFFAANNLNFIPDHIPTTVTDLSYLFHQKNVWTEPLNNLSSWDVSRVTNFSHMFNSAGTFNTDISGWNTSAATNMSTMFYLITSAFNQNLNGWDVSKVTNFQDMWNRARNANPIISNWVPSSATNMSGMFLAANKFNRNISSWNVSNVTNLAGIFWEASLFNSPLNDWDVSNVTNMTQVFRFASAFNQPLNNWDVSNVTNFSNMFEAASVFNQDISGWNVSMGTNFGTMFSGARAFNAPIGSWNVSAATSLGEMFSNAVAFNQPLNSWNVSNVTSMFATFFGATSFNQPLNNWNVGKVTHFSSMFRSSNFNQDISSWNVSAGTNFGSMFAGNQVFNHPLNTWNISAATSLNGMFENARSFNQPLFNWNTANVTDMANMFKDAVIFDQDITGWNTSKVLDMGGMFNGAKVFNQNISTWNVSKVTNFGRMFASTDLFNQPIGAWTTTAALYTNEMFNNAKAFNSYVGEWQMDRVINMSSMFAGTSIFNSDISGWTFTANQYTAYMFSGNQVFNQPIGDWDMSKVITMEAMFQNSVFNQPIGNWNTGNVTNMFKMFQSNKVFNQPIGNWNVSKVQYFREMFQYADVFNQDLPWTTTALNLVWNMFDGAKAFNGDVSSWNMTLVTSLSQMFLNAESFNQPLDSWNVSNVTSFNMTFKGAKVFNRPLLSWNTSKVNDMDRVFEDATAFDQDLGNWDFQLVVNMYNFMGGTVNLNPLNYDSILQRLSEQTITLQTFWSRNELSFGQSKYSKVAKALKDQLIANRSWIIRDGGELRLTITANDEEIYFGEDEPTYSVAYTGLVTGAGEDTMTNNYVFTRTPGSDVGTYTISVTGGDETYYYVSYDTGTLEILKPEIDVSEITWYYVNPFTYDTTTHTVTLVGVPNLVTVTYENNTATNAGTYSASVTITYDTDNYELVGTIEPLTWVIDKATYDLTGVTWSYEGTPFTYDQDMHEVTVSGLPDGVTVSTYDGNSASEPGTYTATVTLVGDTTNYEVPVLEGITWEIFAPTFTVTFDSRGGSSIGSITGIFGSSITAPSNPTRAGFIFNGWSTAIPATMPNGNLALTASWLSISANDYSIDNLDDVLDLSEFEGQDVTVELIVDLLENTDLSEADLATLEAYLRENIGGNVESVLFDIRLLLSLQDDEIEITDIESGFDIDLPVPPEFQGKDIYVIQFINGVATTIEGVYDETTQTIRFRVSGLGTYALAYESANPLTAIAIGGGAIGAGLLGWLFFVLLGKRRRSKKVPTIAAEIEEDESMEDVTIFQKPIAIKQAFYDTLTAEEKAEFRLYFVDDTPQHLVKELVYQVGQMNEAFFMDVYRYLYRYRKLISLSLLNKLTDYGRMVAAKQPKAQSMIYDVATKISYARRKDPVFLQAAIQFARQDIALQRNVLKPRKKFVYSFYRLSIILEKQKEVKEALVLVNEALARELSDRTKGGFERRKAKLKNLKG